MKKRKMAFRRVYFTYLCILTVLVVSALIYVNALLVQYEECQPENRVMEAAAVLAREALDEGFWSKYSLPEVEAGALEQNIDIVKAYLSLYTDGNIEFSQKAGAHREDELFFTLENNGVMLAEIKLKAVGPAVTKLAVLSFREWRIEDIKPVVEPCDYTISVPVSFKVSVNGTALTEEDGIAGDKHDITYTVQNVYLTPDFDITDQSGNTVSYTIKNHEVIADFFQYSLTLPGALKVKVNGEEWEGEEIDDNVIRYNITMLAKPVIEISDYYGNTIDYEENEELSLTLMTISADSRYVVEVSGQPVPSQAVCVYDNPQYAQLVPYVEELPKVNVYQIAILKENAGITVKDENGQSLSMDSGSANYDFTSRINGLAEVPEMVSAEVDVLDIAQKWSLFMSNDMPFSEIKQYFIAGSYQYEAAAKYARGIDITFISEHTLLDPTFTENSVTNFSWIADNCFSVDISFVKNIRLRTGKKVDDVMNDRFYFVKYDDTDDHIDNPAWKIVCMKEIVDNEN